MVKTAVLVGIISMIMMQSVSGAPKINYNQDHVEDVTEKRTEQASTTGKLKVKGHAMNLPDLDGWMAGNSDPYMEVIATDVTGYTETKTTPVRGGTNNPSWDDYLVFSERTWKEMTVKILDYDGSGREPDPLCPTTKINSYSLENKSLVTIYCYSENAIAIVQYTFEKQSIHFQLADHAKTVKTIVHVDSLNYTDIYYNLDIVKNYRLTSYVYGSQAMHYAINVMYEIYRCSLEHYVSVIDCTLNLEHALP